MVGFAPEGPPGSMRAFAETCERVGATSRRTEKVALIAQLLRTLPVAEAALAAVFFGGRPFALRDVTTLDVGGALLRRAVLDVTDTCDEDLAAVYRRHGDLGAATHEILVAKGHEGLGDRSLVELHASFRALAAAHGTAAKLAALRDLLRGAAPIAAKYVIKIITSELRIGSKESLVEEAISVAFGAPLAAVQRAAMLLGDAGETVQLAAEKRLGDAQLELFRAVAPMLASPAESAGKAFDAFSDALVEDKYDGIRAQAHVGRGKVRIFSRTLDDVTAAFPELVPELARFDRDVVLDGEIVAYRGGRALPFSSLQKRLGRKKPSAATLADVPVAMVAFDALYDGQLLIDRPLRDRQSALDGLFAARRPAPPLAPRRGQLALFAAETPPAAAGVIIRAPVGAAESIARVETLFDDARLRGNEGLMVKDATSGYTPGRRGKSWLKLKRELGTLDVVVTAVELGHGKRAGVLSDYTFAVRDGVRHLAIGKAYTGLTDAEIAELTAFFVEHTLADHGHLRVVEPLLVIEVAFNNMMKTKRHPSGLALRFPRIVRVRRDKAVEDIDTLETARAMFERQAPSKPEN